MIENNTISVIITNYRRFKNINAICRAWLDQPVEEVILLDCSDKARKKVKNINDSRFSIISFTKDYGTKTDYAIALLTQGKYIILADDDVLVKEGFVEDLYSWQRKLKGIVGIIGRTFHGEHYRRDTTYYRSDKLDKPKRVGFVGVIYYSPRHFFGFDCKGMDNINDDVWWQMKVFPKELKWVIPTKKYKDLPEANDSQSLFHANFKERQKRLDFYKKYYLKNKEIYDKLWEK